MNRLTAIAKILTSKTRMSKDDISIISSNYELQKAFKTKPKPLHQFNKPVFEPNKFTTHKNTTNSKELFTDKKGEKYPSWIPKDEILGDDWLLNEAYYPFYHQIYNSLSLKMINPKLLEIGVRTGYSAIVFAKALNSKCKYIGIDPNIYIKEGLELAKKTIQKLQEDKFEIDYTLIEGYSSSSSIQSTINLNGPYEFIHIDGEHTYLGKLIDLFIAKNNVTKDGFVLVDDVIHHQMIQDAISVSIELGWFNSFSIVNTLRGLAVLKQ